MVNASSYTRFGVAVSSARPERRLEIRLSVVALLACLTVFFVGCHQAPKEPVTLTFLDLEWSHDSRERDASHEADWNSSHPFAGAGERQCTARVNQELAEERCHHAGCLWHRCHLARNPQ